MIMIRIINCNSAIEFIFCGAFFSNGLCVAAIAPLPLLVDPADDERDPAGDRDHGPGNQPGEKRPLYPVPGQRPDYRVMAPPGRPDSGSSKFG